jgi:hypothetical protein
MKFFIDTANPGEIKKAYETGVMDGVTTKRVLDGLEEGSQEMKRGFFKKSPLQSSSRQAPRRGAQFERHFISRKPHPYTVGFTQSPSNKIFLGWTTSLLGRTTRRTPSL